MGYLRDNQRIDRTKTKTVMKIHSLRPLPFLAAALLAGFSLCATGRAESPKVGDKAPLIEGKDQDGKSWKLADVEAKKIVMPYLYPKNETPGGTKQTCGLGEQIGD